MGRSTHYPVAALNRLAYGSNTSFGPVCGSCAKVTLTSTPLTPVPGPNESGGDGIAFSDSDQQDGKAPSVVVKIIDLCPGLGGPHCNATAAGGNALGAFVHFDLAWPSPTGAIPSSFFPGDHDYGVWDVNYTFVDCKLWAGYRDQAAAGSSWNQQDSACCPLDPPLPSDDSYGIQVLKSAVVKQADGSVPMADLPQTCPPYWQTRIANAALVPNTSNILSKDEGLAAAGNAGSRLAISPWSTLPWVAGLINLPPLLSSYNIGL